MGERIEFDLVADEELRLAMREIHEYLERMDMGALTVHDDGTYRPIFLEEIAQAKGTAQVDDATRAILRDIIRHGEMLLQAVQFQQNARLVPDNAYQELVNISAAVFERALERARANGIIT